MNKRQIRKSQSPRKIRCLLGAMVLERLFGQGPWPADRETCDAVTQTLIDLGLERVCDKHGKGGHAW